MTIVREVHTDEETDGAVYSSSPFRVGPSPLKGVRPGWEEERFPTHHLTTESSWAPVLSGKRVYVPHTSVLVPGRVRGFQSFLSPFYVVYLVSRRPGRSVTYVTPFYQ